MKGTKKIAVLFHANLNDCKGQTNATLDRIKNLKTIIPKTITLDAICTPYKYSKCINILRGQTTLRNTTSTVIEEIPIQIEWRTFTLLDYILKIKFHRESPFFKTRIQRILNNLVNYDLISAHSFLAGEIALELHRKYNIPYCVTWHGSDIHSMPFESKHLMNKIKDIIEHAAMNFFVSNALLKKSEEITKLGNKTVLYNGFSYNFKSYTESKKLELREKHALRPNNKIVAFVGNLIPVKNASMLPAIFHLIKDNIKVDIEFWIIGDGTLRQTIMDEVLKLGIQSDVKFFGNIPHIQMPDLMNCIDLLILPSKNEGLPLVTVEALQCGAKVIGSDVGGISEAIDKENTVALGLDFITRFSNKCVEALNQKNRTFDNPNLDWHKTAQKELDFYMDFLSNNR